MDLKALCTSIPNLEGIAAVEKKRYDKYTNKTIPTKIITTLLTLFLTLNNFIFNSKFYLQIKGFTMGARFASYQCFILDSSIMIWIKSENELKNFIKDLNSKHPSIKLDFKHFKDKIKLLDALLYIEQREKLQTTQ